MAQINFDNWYLDTERGLLFNATLQSKVKLPRKTLLVLIYLIDNTGKTVSKRELIENVWKGNDYVGDQGVSNALWRIRKALGEDSTSPRYLETIPKVGYKWKIFAQYTSTEPSPLKADETAASLTDQVADKTQQFQQYNKNSFKRHFNRTTIAIISLLMFLIIGTTISIYRKDISKLTGSAHLIHSASSNYGVERYPAISPDGSKMLFSWRRGARKSSIYIKELGNIKAPVQITDDSHDDFKPVWSPDGKYFAFIRQDKVDVSCSLMVHDLATSEEYKLTSCMLIADIASLSWSPDGKYLAYNSINLKSDSKTKKEVTVSSISIISLDTRETQVVVENPGDVMDLYPGWSPDSKKLYFVRQNAQVSQGIYAVAITNKKLKPVMQKTDKFKRIFGMSISPDEVIYFTAAEESPTNAKLFKLLPGESTPVKLEASNQHVIDPALDARNNRLYFVKRVEESHLGYIDLNTSVPATKVLPLVQTFNSDLQPTYCEKTDSIVFTSNSSGSTNLWMMSGENNSLTQLTHYGENSAIFWPNCSANGRYIAFTGAIPQVEKIMDLKLYVYDQELNTTFALANNKGIYAPSWNFNNSAILSVDHGPVPHLWLNEFKAQGHYKNLELAFIYTRAEPTGQWLYGFNDKGEIWQISANDYQQRKIIEAELNIMDWGNWVIDENTLFFLKRALDHDEIYSLDITTNERKLIAKLPYQTVHNQANLAYNSKENQLVLGYYLKHISSIQYIELN
ncbi:winged helix-turn-helix domain-containing protein [Aliikangiella coralliicola]|uniref:OmpR/PhoB-type domain-containing protein n=1 Tax=Aliikangiella coralliicola TaxID=2592383 RepID=A0A545U8K8_9GAMM|nr:winged helix-turn-helix domain-containing protein [Aliikangiella coralliicola]TQV85807.1 hypothetical protein FLL46_17940 [Aliikangiella coralliicola]